MSGAMRRFGEYLGLLEDTGYDDDVYDGDDDETRSHEPVKAPVRSEMNDADAKRLVDFAAGLIFATYGNIERVTNKVFLISPANVSVTAEAKQRIVEGGFFNQS